MTDQSPKAVNLLRIYNRLRQSPVTLDVLHQWTERTGIKLSRRSLYRYLNDLENTIHFQGEKLVVYEGEKNKKIWKIEFDKSTDILSQFDINTYYFLRNFIPKSLIESRSESLVKLDKVFYETLSKSKFQTNVDVHNTDFIRSNYIDANYSEKDHLFLEDMVWAIQNHRKIKVEYIGFDIHYFPKNFKKDILLSPLKLLHHFGQLYICTYSSDLKNIIILPFIDIVASSITSIEFNGTKYQKQLADYFDQHFGITPNYDNEVYDVEIEIAAFTGKYVSSMFWHTSQRFEKMANGNTMLYLHCGINRELVGWVIYFLRNARVRKPEILKEKIISALKETLTNYSKDDLSYNSNYLSQ